MDKALSLKERLEELATLGAPQLRAEWTSLFGNPAPRRVSRDILLRGIAYCLQEKMYGGLKPATVKRLKRLASGVQSGDSPAPAPAESLRPGTRLLREWDGHIVLARHRIEHDDGIGERAERLGIFREGDEIFQTRLRDVKEEADPKSNV